MFVTQTGVDQNLKTLPTSTYHLKQDVGESENPEILITMA